MSNVLSTRESIAKSRKISRGILFTDVLEALDRKFYSNINNSMGRPRTRSNSHAAWLAARRAALLPRLLCSAIMLLVRTGMAQVGADELRISKSCLQSGEGFEVAFTKDDDVNFVENWIAVYNTNDLSGNPLNLPDGDMWVWLCGSQTCNPSNSPSSGTVSFEDSSQLWEPSTWPLGPGTYRAVLSRDRNGNSISLATSEQFEIGCSDTSTASVDVEKFCFQNGEPVDMSFRGMPDQPMFVGIYRASDIPDLGILPDSAMRSWLWTCGTTADSGCSVWPSSGDLQFNGLASGEYRAVASVDGSSPFSSLAASTIFQVGGCSGGSGSTESPASAPVPAQMERTIQEARNDIAGLIARDRILIGKFLRLAFHDCVGGCDGCIDMTNLDNAGLVMPIEILQSVVDTYEPQGLSRTDIWMLSAVVASEISETSVGIEFPFQWIGRRTCEELNGDGCGRGADGLPSTCNRFGGPHRPLCHGDTAGTSTIQNFMSDEFGFDAQETAAIMGAHSVGAMRAVNLGFEGQRGWDLTNNDLDAGYFLELVGDGRSAASIPDWRQTLQDNGNLRGIPDRWQFVATVNNVPLTMLNSDVAMVRNLVEGENLTPEGRVTCTFNGPNSCDSDTPFMPFIIQYARELDIFISDYRDALERMIENGYRRDSRCPSGQVCRLSTR